MGDSVRRTQRRAQWNSNVTECIIFGITSMLLICFAWPMSPVTQLKADVCPSAGAKSNLGGKKTKEISLQEYIQKNKDILDNAAATNGVSGKALDTVSSRSVETTSCCMNSTRSSSTVTTCASNSKPIQSLNAEATVSPMFENSAMSINFNISLTTSNGPKTIPVSIKCSNFQPKNINFGGIEKKIV